METHMPMQQVLDMWRHEKLPDGADHPAMSALFDLACQTISVSERQEVLHHLAQCPACAQTLKALMSPDAEPSLVLREARRLAAATPSQPPEEPTLLITEDSTHRIRFIRSIEEDVTFLTVEAIAERERFEHAEITVYDAIAGARLCQGVMSAGTLSWELPGKIISPLRLELGVPARE